MIQLRQVLEALRKAGLTATLKKSQLRHAAVQYLGFCVGQGKIWAIPDKVAALYEAPFPTFRGFWAWPITVVGVSSSSRTKRPPPPLTGITGQRQGNPVAQAIFEDLRTALCTNTILNAPLPNKPFLLYTDTSDVGLEAVLTQLLPET